MTDLFDTPAGAKDEAGVPRDRFGRYVLPDFTNPTVDKPHTRATTFAKSISDTFTLSQWSQRMVAKGLTLRPDLFALAAALPLTDRDDLNKVCESAKEAAGAKSRASIGTALHAFAEQRDLGKDPVIPAQWSPEIAAYTRLIEETGLTFAADHIERIVVIPRFGVAGTYDRIALVTKLFSIKIGDEVFTLEPGDYVILDLKTGRDLSYGWNEIAIQLVLYAMAEAMWIKGTRKFQRMPARLRRDIALVVHLPVREGDAQEALVTLHGVSLAPAWDACELCSQVRTWRKTRNLAAEVVVSSVAGPVADAVAAVENAIDAVSSGDPVKAAVGVALLEAADDAGVFDPAPPAPAQCGAISTEGIVSKPCTMTGRHTVHTDGRIRWPVCGLPPHIRCVQCGQSPDARTGRISHKRGCTDATRGRGATPIPPAAAAAPVVEGLTDEKRCPGCGTSIKEAMSMCVACALAQAPPMERTPAPEPAPVPVPVAEIPTVLRPPTWAERIDAAGSPGELSGIRKEALAAGEWSLALQTRGLKQLEKLRTP